MARSAEEIREYMVMQEYNDENIDNIPEIIAASQDSSYSAADVEARRRYNNPEYRELHMARSADEIREYMSNRLSPNFRYLIDEISEIIGKSYFAADRIIKIISSGDIDIIY